MPTLSNNNTPQPEENTKRQERANRILDAASELVQRWGYKKTTIDDIARQARVAKGTIYLHWKTREELFIALVKRERFIASQDLTQQLTSDPEGGTLHAIIKYSTLAALKNPLLKALMLRDTEMLGQLARSEGGELDVDQRTSVSQELIRHFRDKGLIRTDLSIKAQIYMLSAISMGFILIDQFLPDKYRLSPSEAVELLEETVHLSFETRTPTPIEQREAIAQLDQAITTAHERDQKELV